MMQCTVNGWEPNKWKIHHDNAPVHSAQLA